MSKPVLMVFAVSVSLRFAASTATVTALPASIFVSRSPSTAAQVAATVLPSMVVE